MIVYQSQALKDSTDELISKSAARLNDTKQRYFLALCVCSDRYDDYDL